MTVRIDENNFLESLKELAYTLDRVDSDRRERIVSITDADSPYTVIDQGLILADATSGTITINLPAASIVSHRPVIVKKVDASGNAVTIDGDGSETIDGATTLALSSQYDVNTIVSDGSAWYII